MRTPRKPRPGPEGTRSDLIEELNRLMAEEMEVCLRYFQMRYRLGERDRATAASLFDDAIDDTLQHAAAIAEHIRALGHVPVLRIDLTLGGGPTRLETAVGEALEVEQQALDAYEELLPHVSGEPGLEAFVREQIDVETRHLTEMRAFAAVHATVKLLAGSRSPSRDRGVPVRGR